MNAQGLALGKHGAVRKLPEIQGRTPCSRGSAELALTTSTEGSTASSMARPVDRDQLPTFYMLESPMIGFYPFHAEHAAAALREFGPALRRALTFWRRPSRDTSVETKAANETTQVTTQVAHSPGDGWRFHLLHATGLLVTLPMFAIERLLVGPLFDRRRGETVFLKANRAVLTALAYAFME